MSNETCPHCGAEIGYDDLHYMRFKCGAVVWRDGTTAHKDYACYERRLGQLERHLEQMAAEIEQLKQAVPQERKECAWICYAADKATLPSDLGDLIMARGKV